MLQKYKLSLETPSSGVSFVRDADQVETVDGKEGDRLNSV